MPMFFTLTLGAALPSRGRNRLPAARNAVSLINCRLVNMKQSFLGLIRAHIGITDKGDLFAIRRPRRGVDRTLPAIDIRQHFWRSFSIYRQQPDIDMFVGRVNSRGCFLL